MQPDKQNGFTLVEVVVSIAVLSLVAVVIIAALGTSSKAVITTDERETAKNIAEMEMEYIKNIDYLYAYDPRPVSDEYPGYGIVTSEDGKIHAGSVPGRFDGNIQKIDITVVRGEKRILTVTGYKTR